MGSEVLANGRLIKPDGSAWADVIVTCTLVNFSTTELTQRPPHTLTATTADDGSYSFSLWRNTLGDYASHYLFKFPNDREKRKAIVTDVTPDIVEISRLLIASTNPGSPTYPSLIRLINDLFAEGEFAGTADIIPLNPPIIGLGLDVQEALEALNIREVDDAWILITTNAVATRKSRYIVENPTLSPSQIILPTTALVGFEFSVLAAQGTFQITQNPTQQIRFGDMLTTDGSTGGIISSKEGDYIKLVCTRSPTIWSAISIIGNLNFF